jgi:hypothetical protein
VRGEGFCVSSQAAPDALAGTLSKKSMSAGNDSSWFLPLVDNLDKHDKHDYHI